MRWMSPVPAPRGPSRGIAPPVEALLREVAHDRSSCYSVLAFRCGAYHVYCSARLVYRVSLHRDQAPNAFWAVKPCNFARGDATGVRPSRPGQIPGTMLHAPTAPSPAAPHVATHERRFARSTGSPARRFVKAFESLGDLPALAHTRDRLLQLLRDPHSSTEDIVVTIESDIGLALRVLRHGASQGAPAPANVADCITAIGDRLVPLIERMPSFDFFDRTSTLTQDLSRLRVHALATQAAVQRICGELQQPVSGELAVAALMHDLGKLVFGQSSAHYGELLRASGTPEQRVRVEQQAFGIDHAAAGGAAIRRLGLPVGLAVVVENHHSEQAQGDAALVRLGDMLAHYEALGQVDPEELTRTARLVGLDQDAVRRLLHNSPRLPTGGRPHLDPCPLSPRQLDVLRLLRDGRRYKQIAAELGLSDSTVRSHTNVAYRRLGVSDRAQAVLQASARGWI